MNKNNSILIIEDEIPLQNAIRIKMEKNGFEIFTARNIKTAMEILEENMVSVIWLDHYLLGEESGLDFVVRLKNDKEKKNIPIFVISNTASPEKVTSYLELGVNNFFTKANNKLEDIILEIKKAI